MRIKNSLVQQGILVIVFPLVCQIIVVIFLAGEVGRIRDEQLKTAHARDMISMAHSLVLDTIGSIYEIHMTGDQEGMIGMESSAREALKLAREIAEMRQKASGNVSESRIMLSVDASAGGLFEILRWAAQEQSRGLHHWKSVDERCYRSIYDGSKNLMQSLQALVELEEPVMAQNKDGLTNSSMQFLLAVACLNFALGLGLGLLYVAKIVKALKSIDKNRILLAERRPLEPIISAHDELVELDLAVHSAAASLASALEAGSRMIKEAGNLICSLDNDLLFLEANPACAKILGVEADQLVGRSVRSFVSAEAVEKLRQAQALEQESKLEIMLTRADGSKIHTHWAVKTARAPSVLFCIIEDISEQKRRQGMRQRFLDAVRASLRTPIASIVEALQEVSSSSAIGPDEQKAVSDLQRASRSARQCILLIDVLLDAQSAETGAIKIEPRPYSLGQIVQESIELVETIAERKGVFIEQELVHTRAICDPFKLTQATVNFLSNAIKFSPPDGRIFVSIKETESWLEVSVTDQGPGISEHYRERVFKPFVQVPGEKAKEGTGLGLAICKQIIDAHAGEIGVKPSILSASGSTFWYRIPKQ